MKRYLSRMFIIVLASVTAELFLPSAAGGTSSGEKGAEGIGSRMLHRQVETVMPLYGILETGSREAYGKEKDSGESDERLKLLTLEDMEQGREKSYREDADGDIGAASRETGGGEMSSGEMSSGEMSSGEMSGGEMSGGEAGSGEISGGEAGGGEAGSGETGSGEMSGGEAAGGGGISDRDIVVAENGNHEAKTVVRQQTLELAEYSSYEELVKDFYTIDGNTMAGKDQLNIEKLSSKDLQIDKEGDGPQILIYHTHSQEAYVDSVPGDASTSVVGVGEYLTQILQQEYGYRVLHCTEQFDVENRNQAYGKALPVLEQILKENPSIQVVIDLHRDEMPEGTRLVKEIDGKPTARFMFFNGVSRTKKTGDISYLKNENIDGNLAFSFQMQVKCMEYYPGLTRKIYLKGYRYNMHLRERSLLVELGAQNNTVQEAMNACGPLAHALDLVLSGE